MNTEVKADGISPERLKKYADFVEVHSDLQPDGTLVYNPEKALVGLLSILTPDPKGIVLAGMRDGIIYSTESQLYKDSLSYLDSFGDLRSRFPMSYHAPWRYCEWVGKNGEKFEGSLAKIGAVVREVVLHENLETFGYMRSQAGKDLGTPLVYQAIEFVNRARESIFPHKYNSMWRLLGTVSSPNDQRRPWAVYNVIEFLLENSGLKRKEDIIDGLREKNISENVIGHTLNSLGASGIINYQSPQVEKDGKRGKGWVKYYLNDKARLYDLGKLYKDIKNSRGYFHKQNSLSRVSRYILDHPDEIYVLDELYPRFPDLNHPSIQGVFSALLSIGVLNRRVDSFSGRIHSKAQANDLSRMFYEMVLLPASEEALTLNPISTSLPVRHKVYTFLKNFQDERSNIGTQGGEEVREKILSILLGQGEMKLSHIAQEMNELLGRGLSRAGIANQIDRLISQGIIVKPRPGFYRLKGDSESRDSSRSLPRHRRGSE